jgi:hypothetical protein
MVTFNQDRSGTPQIYVEEYLSEIDSEETITRIGILLSFENTMYFSNFHLLSELLDIIGFEDLYSATIRTRCVHNRPFYGWQSGYMNDNKVNILYLPIYVCEMQDT